MKTFRVLFFTLAALFAFSCSQLNLKNPTGTVYVSLPSSSRMIVSEGQSISQFVDISYKISLYYASGDLVTEKPAKEGEVIEFPDLAEGSYMVKGICYAGGDGIAAGSVNANVTGGEVTPVPLVLSYNRPEKIDINRSSIKYTGKTEFQNEDEMNSYVGGDFKNFLSAEVVFTNGWTETVTDSNKFSAERNRNQAQTAQTRGESMAFGGSGAPQDVIVSGERTLYQFKVTCTLSESKKIETTVNLYVVNKQQINDPIVPPDLTVGLSADKPCTTSEELEQAIANVKDNGNIYLAGKDGVLEFNGTFSLNKSCTIYSTVEDLQVKRKDNDTYFYIGSEVMIDARAKKITFTDDSGIMTVSAGNGYFYGPGTLKAYFVDFTNIKGNAVQVGSAVLSGCSFTDISSNYGAVYVEAEKSAQIVSCTFNGNTSVQSENYGDIYFVKYDASSLTLDENVTSDIRIYVANESYPDPEIDVTEISFVAGKKLRVKVDTIPDGGLDNITLFKCSYDMKNNMTFAINNNAYTGEYELLDIVEDYEDIPDDAPFWSMFDEGLQKFYVYKGW